MSYVTDKFKAGNVKTRGKVCGWYFEESSEFRPLMRDAMAQLLEAGLVTQEHVEATEIAEAEHAEKVLTAYAKSEEEFWNNPDNLEAQNERRFEMRAAFGPGTEVVNVFTGRKTKV